MANSVVTRRVAYFHCDDFTKVNTLSSPYSSKRYAMTHELLTSLDLLKFTQRLRPRWLKEEDLQLFHDGRYLRILNQLSLPPSQQIIDEHRLAVAAKRCGLVQQSTVHPDAYQFSRGRASGSVGCAEIINSEQITFAINFEGGMFRAKTDQAIAGHFINDVVLCLLTLCENHNRVLYINVGPEHCDGVEEAFYTTNKVMCLSFHGNQESDNDTTERQMNSAASAAAPGVVNTNAEGAGTGTGTGTDTGVNSNGKRPAPDTGTATNEGTASTAATAAAATTNKKKKTDGNQATATLQHPVQFSFGPTTGTGKADDVGHGNGLKCNCNIPLANGLTDLDLLTAFGPVFAKALLFYRPSAIVMNVNASSVAGDRGKSGWNLSSQGFNPLISLVRQSNIPMILLGSGGEHVSNTAKTFAACTYAALGMADASMPKEIPGKDMYINDYHDRNIKVEASNMINEVDREKIMKEVVANVCTGMSGPPLKSDDDDEFDEDM